MWFDVEQARYGSAAKIGPAGSPVFVCGLARAGTSVIVRLLHETSAFASLTYRDMPFPLAPNLNKKLFPRQALADVERGHRDGLYHDLNTPEAIEEIFWRTQDAQHYVARDHVRPHRPDAETIDMFRDYMALVRLRYGRARYLSKNNANVLRLPALVDALPGAVFIHPFRHPVQQATSLLRQHRAAVRAAQADPFRTRYMRLLGHYDFGADHRPFFGAGLPFPPTDIEHWLALWTATYRRLMETTAPTALFLNFDSIAARGSGSIDALQTASQVQLDPSWLRSPPVRAATVSGRELGDALVVYDELIERSARARNA